GTVTFDPGETSKTVHVTVNGDTTFESDEGLSVTLTDPVNAGLADDAATGTIQNDDAVPSVSIDDQSTNEGDAGGSTLTLHVSLSNPSDQTITVDYTTNDDTATVADADYDAASGTVTFLPGDTTGTVDVTVLGDTAHEADEDFTVDLSSPSNATIADDQGMG